MLLPRRPAGFPQARVHYSTEPGYGNDAVWLQEQLKVVQDDVYISSGEAEHQVYAQLEDDLRFARDEINSRIRFVAGPIISVPEDKKYENKQEGRENLSPVVRLAMDGKIELYAAEKRMPYSFRVFDNIAMANVLGTYPPGERPKGARYYYHWWTESASWKSKFTEATSGKSPVKGNYLDHFLFLTDREIADLKKLASNRGKDIGKIDLTSCREFWDEHSH